MKNSGQPTFHRSSASPKLNRICIWGGNGSLAGKLAQWYETGAAEGVQFFAADIVPETEFRPNFTGFAGYFDVTNGADRQKLIELARDQPFDLGYDATWPNAHLLNAMNMEPFFKHILVTKPFVSIEQFSALEALMHLAAFRCVREKLLMHDHFANKPGLTALLSSLSAAHSLYGKFSRMLIVITERRSVNDPEEIKRQEALQGGMVPDLASHAVMMIQLLTRKGLMSRDSQGNYFRRLDRTIVPTACVRAQMKLAALPENVDTACIIEYMVPEKLTLAREDGTVCGKPFSNTFYVLMVCGKGLSVTADASRDLKAVEISFQGQGRATGIIDLETNTLNEVLERVPGLVIPRDNERIHRGINRPVMDLIGRWHDFSTDEDFRTSLFQDKELVWENMKVLSETTAISRPGLLPSYAPLEEIHNFVNTHIGPANGFRYFGTTNGNGWPMKEPPLHLMRGRPLLGTIP